MKRFVTAAFGAALMLAAAPAFAADLPVAAAPIDGTPFNQTASYNWSGMYVGVNGGYGWGTSNWTAPAVITTGNFGMSGGVVGGTVGLNWQTGNIVWGLEGDFDYNGIRGSTGVAACAGGTATCNTSGSWLATARARLGWSFDRWMPFVTGGAAFGDVKSAFSGGIGSNTVTNTGWTVGGGIEAALRGNWTAKAEYLYVDLGNGVCGAGAGSGLCAVTSPVPVRIRYTTSIVRLGLNYRF